MDGVGWKACLQMLFVIVAMGQCQRASVVAPVVNACVRKCDSTKPLEIVGSRYSDIGDARIVCEGKLQQGIVYTTQLIGLN